MSKLLISEDWMGVRGNQSTLFLCGITVCINVHNSNSSSRIGQSVQKKKYQKPVR